MNGFPIRAFLLIISVVQFLVDLKISASHFPHAGGVEVDVINMNKATTTIVDDFGVHHKPDEIKEVMGH